MATNVTRRGLFGWIAGVAGACGLVKGATAGASPGAAPIRTGLQPYRRLSAFDTIDDVRLNATGKDLVIGDVATFDGKDGLPEFAVSLERIPEGQYGAVRLYGKVKCSVADVPGLRRP